MPAVMLREPLLGLIATLLLTGPRLFAGMAEPAPTIPPPDTDPIFRRGALELQTTDGAFFSLQHTANRRPNIDYELTVIRAGYMLDSPHQGGTFLRGNDELLLEGTGGPIFQGPGTGLGSLSIIYRRDFLAPNAWLVPDFAVGGGGLYSNAYRDQTQGAIGSKFEFDLQPASVYATAWRITGRRTRSSHTDMFPTRSLRNVISGQTPSVAWLA